MLSRCVVVRAEAGSHLLSVVRELQARDAKLGEDLATAREAEVAVRLEVEGSPRANASRLIKALNEVRAAIRASEVARRALRIEIAPAGDDVFSVSVQGVGSLREVPALIRRAVAGNNNAAQRLNRAFAKLEALWV